MKTRSHSSILFLLLLLLSLLVSGCSSDAQPAASEDLIVGNWKTVDGKNQMLFFEDGTVSAGSIGGNMDTGTWHMVDGVLSISDSYGETQVFNNVEITENTLVLESMGITETFYRDTDEAVAADKTLDELNAQLLESDIFSETAKEISANSQGDLTYSLIDARDGSDQNGEFVYDFTQSHEYTYLTELVTERITFAYNPSADDFYVLSTESNPGEEVWNIVGHWDYAPMDPYETLQSLAVDITRADSKTFDISYTYEKRTEALASTTEEFSGSGTYTATEPYAPYYECGYDLIVDLDDDVIIYVSRDDGVLVQTPGSKRMMEFSD